MKGFKDGMKGDEDDKKPAGEITASGHHDRRRSEGKAEELGGAARAPRAPPHAAMFDIGFSEMVVIGVVALVVIGPERLPKVARTLGVLFGRLQRYVDAGEVRHQPRDGAGRARQGEDRVRERRALLPDGRRVAGRGRRARGARRADGDRAELAEPPSRAAELRRRSRRRRRRSSSSASRSPPPPHRRSRRRATQ